MRSHELFEVLARTTWISVGRSFGQRIQLGEDAITSVNLIAIASHKSKCVVVEDTRVHESIKGCDFELWVGSAFLGWNRYAIQAKKIDPASSRYAQLNHKVGKTRQIDLLETYAKLNRAASLYCFFNNSTKPYTWSCNLEEEKEQLGCSVTPSGVVRTAIGKRGARNFTWVHNSPSTLPWRCLVRCPELFDRELPPRVGWQPRVDYWHSTLPPEMTRLQETRSTEALDNPTHLYHPDSPLRPSWIGVIDVSVSPSGA